MSSLPFRLAPHPDEILGSWLARLRLHNSDGWWWVALRNAGYGPRSDAYVFDIPAYSPLIEAFFRRIGMAGYEQVLLDLTTLPYWLAFDAGPPDSGFLPGTNLLPLLGTRKGVVRSVSAMARRYRARAGIRFCPRCLDEDVRTVGEPYWHRAHQLPNVTCCPDHRVRLQTCCPRCGRACIPDEIGRIPLPRLNCECGLKLNEVAIRAGKADVRQKLAIVSRDALLARLPVCSRSQMHAFLRSRLHSRELGPVIKAAYGQWTQWDSFPSPDPHRDDRRRLSRPGDRREPCSVGRFDPPDGKAHLETGKGKKKAAETTDPIFPVENPLLKYE